ncbi:ankyrin repeat domain-containing protein [Roseateles sp. P5_E1]
MLSVLEGLQQFWLGLVDENGLDIPLTKIDQLNAFGEGPIHIAAWKGSSKQLIWLIENGANINQRGEFGMTPLHYAYMGERRENIDVLIRAGADSTMRCDRGLLPPEGRPES